MKRLIALGIFGVFLFFSVTIWAQVPQLVNYQGRLTDDKGIPIITPTTVRFSLYQGGDAATPGSGTLCYQEDASATPDDNGVFSHLIGSGTVIFGSLDGTVFQTSEPVYLEITIDPAGANETLLPRKQIVTVGYSFKSELADDADTVDGQDASAFAPVVHNHDAEYVNEGQSDSVTSAMIVDGTIVDADINAGANIAGSKIDPTGLDADLLDGKDSEDFVHTAGDDMTGTLNVNTATQYALYGATSNTSGQGVYGRASASSGTNYGIYGTTNSSSGYAVYGSAPICGVYGIATTLIGTTYGVYGYSISNGGRGVYGYATADSGTTYGVFGVSASDSGRGVYGYALATSGTNYGVYGKSFSSSGYGVYGTALTYAVYGEASATTGTTYGVYGKSNSPDGVGVHGKATSTTGTNYGVYGTTASTSDYAYASGVYGEATATSGTNSGVYGTTASSGPWASGVYGEATSTSGGNGVHAKSNSPDGRAVYAIAPNHPILGYATADSGPSTAVEGTSNSSVGYGVYGNAPYCGVRGVATGTTTDSEGYGVYGRNYDDIGYGVFGHASDTGSGGTTGVFGRSDSDCGFGVFGFASDGSGTNYGVYGQSNSDNGYSVYGRNLNDGYAGYFEGKLHITKDLTVDGSKWCVQPIDNGKKVRLSAMESPEIWFEDFGTAQLVNGQAVVNIDSVFIQAANTGITYFVFLTPNGECQGLYISRKDKDSFEVQELGGGTSSISFDYRIVAKRRGYEEVRFEEFTEPEQPPAEPNLPVEKK